MSKLYRGPSIDASYQDSVHLAKGFQRRRLKCEKLTDDGYQVMAKQSAGRHVAPYSHIILIPSQLVVLLPLNAVCLDSKKQIPILWSLD
jgi:hypothetical protein